jgi:hypothetical protein
MMWSDILPIANLAGLVVTAIAVWNRTNSTSRILEANLAAIEKRLARIEDRAFGCRFEG